MIPYKNFKAELLPAPVGVDLAIQKIQVHLASKLPWLQIAFGRCTKQIVRTSDKRYEGLESVPEVYLNREPISVMVNDNLKSYCFFNAKDPVNLDDEINANQDVDIIFWMNLKLIDPEKKYNFVEELRLQVLRALRFTDFKVTESFMEFDEVFSPFTITDGFRKFLKPPYAAFKIAGNLVFNYLECIDPDYFISYNQPGTFMQLDAFGYPVLVAG